MRHKRTQKNTKKGLYIINCAIEYCENQITICKKIESHVHQRSFCL